jgi:predicted ATPase
MAIQVLEIKGFRSLRDVRWTPGRLNVLIGPNGSGKSNLLDAIVLLREAVQGKLPEGIVRRGGISPLLWDEQDNFLTWDLRLQEPNLAYRLELKQLGATSSYTIPLEHLMKETTTHLERVSGTALFLNPKQRQVKYDDPIPEGQTLLSLVAGPFGNPVARRFQQGVETWSVSRDIRIDPDSLTRRESVARFEKRIAPDGQNLVPVLHTLYTGNRNFKETVDAAMHAAFGTDYGELLFPPAADQRIQLRLHWKSLRTDQSAVSLSDGTLRFLILLAILANPEPGDLIAIDEPETGLHPSMFPILAELASEAAERSQVVFTTHSPQFLDAFTGEPPVTTVVEWSNGETRLSTVDGYELRRWLEKYSLGALFRSGELEDLT